MRKTIALSLLALLGSCATSTTSVEEFPLATRVKTMPAQPRPKLLFAERRSEVAGAVPYAMVHASCADATREHAARVVWTRAAKLAPDVVIVQDGGSQYVGSVGQYWGWGVSSSTPIYARQMHGVCCKMPAARIGYTTNKDGMVTALEPESAAREAGVQEGDTMLSIQGQSIVYGDGDMLSPHYAVMLDAQPGQEVELVWIRPGTGRMSGKGKLIALPRTWMMLRDSIPWEAPVTAVDNY